MEYEKPVKILEGNYINGKKAIVYAYKEPLSREHSHITYLDESEPKVPNKHEWNQIKDLLNKYED